MWPIDAPVPLADRQETWPSLDDDNHLVKSVRTRIYNCIAWAYEINDRKLWPGQPPPPGYAWLPEVNGANELDMLKNLYINAGYEECEDGMLEEGYKKVAIYVNSDGPQHAALQMESGRWTSKLGSLEDIEHETPEVLNGDFYGNASVFLKKVRE